MDTEKCKLFVFPPKFTLLQLHRGLSKEKPNRLVAEALSVMEAVDFISFRINV